MPEIAISHRRSARIPTLAWLLTAGCVAGLAQAQSAPGLAAYFGFDEPRYIVADRGLGPAVVADFDGDGLLDLAFANNSKSRIEIHVQRSQPRTDQEIERDLKPNELAPSRYYNRVEVSVPHRVSAFITHDIDADGRLDIIYAGQPAELVVLRQVDRLTFDMGGRRRVPGLAASAVGLEIADVVGGPEPELLTVVSGRINVFSLSGAGVVGQPVELGSDDSSAIVAFFSADYNGDGLQDILGVIPDDAAPLRLWLQKSVTRTGREKGKLGLIGPEARFEMPALREAEPIRFPGRNASSIGVIERASRRSVYYDLCTSSVDLTEASGVERDAASEVYSFPGAAGKGRSVAVADIDGDGTLDLIAADQKGNSLLFYPQDKSVGLSRVERFSALKDPKSIAVGQWDDKGPLEVFTLSEADKSVGVSVYDPENERLSFPQPLPLATEGASPVAMTYARFKDGPALIVVVKERRDHTLEIFRPGPDNTPAAPITITLTDINRPPQSLLAGDFDHDGSMDVALFTPGEPLAMVRSIDGPASGAEVLTDKRMPQFGLVQAAGPDNTALLDVDGDGHEELLIADQNFVRACSFTPGRGWRVIEQITAPDPSASLSSLTVLSGAGDEAPAIVAYDKNGKRLLIMRRGEDEKWTIADRLRYAATNVSSLFAGSFSGRGPADILCVADDAFAIIQLAGERLSLDEFAAFRSDHDDRLEHEIEVGDLNSDGYLDAVVLDAREQMCQIFTFSANRRLYLATEFKVFESRLFSRGDEREFQPSAAIIADLTGDNANDLVLQVHDRYIIYPQMTR